MRAVVCREYGPPERLEVAERESPAPGKGQVLVAVKAAGVNFPDTLIIQGKYQFQPPLPFTPGSDVAGVVRAVGEGVESVRAGDRVMGFTGTGGGGFAEEAICDARSVVPIPAGVELVAAAAFGLTYSTSYYALKDRGRLQSGETLLVLGAAGGVGLAAVELGRVIGARVIAAASSDEKLAVCRRYGAEEVINYASEDLRERIKALTGGEGVDVVFDPVGGSYAEPALRGMGWDGRYLVVGFAAGEIPRIPLNLPLLKGCSVVGVFWGSFAAREAVRNAENLRTLVAWLADGTIKPLVSATYPLEEVARALDDILQRRVTGKVVLVM
ncbi:MAG TPA: NADPH:quinone oxidoreductase family protein [Ktedonobacterales bacterium]